MIWCSGWKLASAVSNSGGLGIIGSGSMYPDVLEEHIVKCKNSTTQPYAVNLPMIYPDIDQHIQAVIKHQVPIVFTSAGNPVPWTAMLKENGIKVVHVVSSLKFALKAESAGVDAVVAEGFEAGGHNGIDETTTFALIPTVKKQLNVPLIAAGGIGSGRGMLAAMALGADAVQIGSRFVASQESSAHINFKQKVVETDDGGTKLTLKELTPVRLIKNDFFNLVEEAYHKDLDVDGLKELLGRGRAKKGMFEGDLTHGELEIGQIASIIDGIEPAAKIISDILKEFNEARSEFNSEKYNFQ
jgi:enoyl-[acyl-carrier protein] reductase II